MEQPLPSQEERKPALSECKAALEERLEGRHSNVVVNATWYNHGRELLSLIIWRLVFSKSLNTELPALLVTPLLSSSCQITVSVIFPLGLPL